MPSHMFSACIFILVNVHTHTIIHSGLPFKKRIADMLKKQPHLMLWADFNCVQPLVRNISLDFAVVTQCLPMIVVVRRLFADRWRRTCSHLCVISRY